MSNLFARLKPQPNHSLADWNERWAPAARKVAQAEIEDFVELIRIGGLDPAQHFRFADWTRLSFAGCDLRGFDFTGAKLLGCDFTDALITGARFDQARIARAGFEAEGETNLRSAKDWDDFVRGWRKAQQLAGDDHLFAGDVFQDAPFAPEMVVIPPGRFMMGSPPDEPQRSDDEGPQHEVTIACRLAVGRYSVTFDEWDFAQADKDWRRITGIAPAKPDDRGWGRGNRPVINVSHQHAEAYVKWLTEKTGKDYRLLTEAEWEYVARAGTTTPFWWGASITPVQANYNGKYPYEGGSKGLFREKTVPVKSFQPNPWGLYQVHGNVWEWCADSWRPYSAEAVTDPIGPLDGAERALRGGSWDGNARDVRAALRYARARGFRSSYIGFRCARVRS